MRETPHRSRLDEAAKLMSDGNFVDARARLQAVTDEFPESAETWKMLGVAEHKLGDLPHAVEHLVKSLEIDQKDADAWASLGGVYVSVREYEKATTCYERAVLAEPANTYALLNLLTLHGKTGPITHKLAGYQHAIDDGKRRCREQLAQGLNIPWCAYDLAQIAFFESNWEDFDSTIRDAVSRSSAWQIDSAVKTYEALADSKDFSAGARRALDTIARIRAV